VPVFPLLLVAASGRSAVAAAVLVHAAASVALLAVAPGTAAEPSVEARRLFVAAHAGAWTLAWTLWSLSSLSYGALLAVWWSRVRGSRLALLGLSAGIAGLPLDLAGESACAALMAGGGASAEAFASAEGTFRLASALAANGLYTAGGAALTIASARSGFLRGPVLVLGGTVWVAGLALSIAAVVGSGGAMTASGAALMALFIPFAAGLWLRLGRP